MHAQVIITLLLEASWLTKNPAGSSTTPKNKFIHTAVWFDLFELAKYVKNDNIFVKKRDFYQQMQYSRFWITVRVSTPNKKRNLYRNYISVKSTKRPNLYPIIEILLRSCHPIPWECDGLVA